MDQKRAPFKSGPARPHRPTFVKEDDLDRPPKNEYKKKKFVPKVRKIYPESQMWLQHVEILTKAGVRIENLGVNELGRKQKY